MVEEITSKHIFNERIGIAFFYFNFQAEAKTQSEASFLAILIKQLCRRQSEFSESLKLLYKTCLRNDQLPSVAEYKRQLGDIIRSFDHVFLMIDAVDECRKEYRHNFLEYITSLLGLQSGKLKIFVTSRPEPDIKVAFTSGRFPVIQIEATKVAEDIVSYVRHELLHRTHPYCNLADNQDLRMEIERVLVSKSNGMCVKSSDHN